MQDETALENYYKDLTDGELLNLGAEDGLSPEAEQVFTRELAKRNLGRQHIDRYSAVPERLKRLERARYIRNLETEQANAAVAKELLKNNDSYDPFWNSGPRPPRIWRIGAGILGMFLLSFSIFIFYSGIQEHGVVPCIVASLIALASSRLFWNAFKPSKNARKDSGHE